MDDAGTPGLWIILLAVLGRGRIVWQGTPAEIRADSETQSRWLGI